MKQISMQLITALAPNANAVANGKKISASGGFIKLGASKDDTFYMGECKGSGKSVYEVSADFIQPDAPVFRCSCPSHQFPCKHSVGLLFEMMAGKPFPVCEIPESILEKRKKKAAGEKEKAKSAPPKPVSKAARTKKLKKQLEGLDLTEKMIAELLNAGLGTLTGKSIQSYRELAKQLGDYYLPGPQIELRRLTLEIVRLQEDKDESHYAAALHILTRLQALIQKARAYLTEKLESGSVEDDDSVLYEDLGGIWQLARLQQLGLKKENAKLLQLSFDVYLDEARGEYIDLGYWVDIDTGEVYATYNYRPLKALKYVKQEDSIFETAQIPLLTFYPGGLNRRARWEQITFSPVTAEDMEKIKKNAYQDLASAVKVVKNQIKNTLDDDFAILTLTFRQIGQVGERLVLKDNAGNTILLQDRTGREQTVYRLPMLPDSALLENQTVCGAFFYDEAQKRICLQPYSILTEDAVIRLLY